MSNYGEPTADIVERLRELCSYCSHQKSNVINHPGTPTCHHCKTKQEAADEIERLRADKDTNHGEPYDAAHRAMTLAKGEWKGSLAMAIADQQAEIERLRAERDGYKKELEAIAFAQQNGLGERDMER